MPATSGSATMRDTISHWKSCFADVQPANTKIAMTITQSRNAVPQRTWIRLWRCTTSGVELVAGLVGVDRLVLGGVVLEDALQVGDQRDQRQVGDEHDDAQAALDEHELPGCRESYPGKSSVSTQRRDLEECRSRTRWPRRTSHR